MHAPFVMRSGDLPGQNSPESSNPLSAPLESPFVAGFVAALDPINALADEAPGFVWRLTGADGNSTSIRAFVDDQLLLNMSLWESLEALKLYVYQRGHRDVLRRRREW